MSRQKWYMDDFINCGLWFVLFGTLFFGLCSAPSVSVEKKCDNNTAGTTHSKSTNAPKQIHTAQNPEELKRMIELYGRFNKQKTAQFGVFARYNKINNMGK